MLDANLQSIFVKLLDSIPQIANEKFWMQISDEKNSPQLQEIVNILVEVAANKDDSLNDPDLKWLLNEITIFAVFHGYGNLGSKTDDAIFNLSMNVVKSNKATAFLIYSSNIFKGKHKEDLIQTIIDYRYVNYVIEKSINEFYSNIDEINASSIVELLYDFRASVNDIKCFKDAFWDASSYIEDSNISFDEKTYEQYKCLAMMFISGKKVYYYHKQKGEDDV